MFPVVFRIGSFAVTSFGVMMFFSFVVGAWILGRQLERYRINPQLAWDLLAWIAVGGIVGAKLWYLALHASDWMANPIRETFSRGGLVWYGGFVGGVVAYWLQIRGRKLPMATMFDATAPALAIAIAIGRIGCFLVGDDYGLPTNSWVGVIFPEGASPPSTAGYLRSVGAHIPATIPDSQLVPVHPTQLYEVGIALVMFALLMRWSRRKHHRGEMFALFMIMYAVERFFIEIVRAKGDRIVFGLSTAQTASIVLVILGVWLLIRSRKGELAPDPAPAAATTGGGAKKGGGGGGKQG
jgi:phosphatidylglycerol:prolipoprotein diacylglycerol transferase